MPENAGINGYVSTRKMRKGPATYRAAKAKKRDAGNFSGQRTKPKNNKHISMVDRKVKRVSNKIIRTKPEANPGMAAFNYNHGVI